MSFYQMSRSDTGINISIINPTSNIFDLFMLFSVRFYKSVRKVGGEIDDYKETNRTGALETRSERFSVY